jgi:hypothetical protein
MGETCTAVWTSERRAPADAGGRRSSRRVEVDVDREGVWRGGKLRVADDGGALKTAGAPDAIPASLAEVVLARRVPLPPRRGWQSALPPGPDVCVDVFDEATGQRGRACARRDGDALAATVLGVEETVVPAADGFPASVAIPQQAARFVRDAEATAPRRPPRLHGTTVAGPADPSRAASFCGVARDPEADGSNLGFLPPPRAEGGSCLEKTAAWLNLPPDHPLVRHVVRSHTSYAEVGKVAAAAGVKKLVLSHFVPAEGALDTEAVLGEIRKSFGGEVIFGEDLLEVR